jgi:DNA-binding NtrC family response regulator
MSHKKRTTQKDEPLLPCSKLSEKTPLTIVTGSGTTTNYLRHDTSGNIILEDSLDAAYQWSGLHIKGYSDQPIIIATSDAMLRVFKTVVKAAASNLSVLIEGKTGTGKELIAKALGSVRYMRGGLFRPVNCISTPETLWETELFGHVKGAFTGATEDRRGEFEMADNGTLFLDELQEMPLNIQAKLLRVIEDGAVTQVGSNKPEVVDVRVICAVPEDPLLLIKKGKLREDLFFRVNAVPIKLPQLCERKEDIPILVTYFLLEKRREVKRRVSKILAETMYKLINYAWPGNVRQLRNVVYYVSEFGEGPILYPEEFTSDLLHGIDDMQGMRRTSKEQRGNRYHSRTEKVREAIRQKPNITAKELAAMEGCSVRTIERDLAELKKDNTVTVVQDKADHRQNLYYLRDDLGRL